MQWFIEKGKNVEVNKPKLLKFAGEFLVSDGRPSSHTTMVWCDRDSSTAPIHRNNNVKKLATLEADLSHLSAELLGSSIVTLADGQDYYRISGAVEATYSSESTEYVFLWEGELHDTATTEYV